jgi:hypothetical protein
VQSHRRIDSNFDIIAVINPAPRGHHSVAILRFFCDESWAGEQKVKVRTFTVAGFMGKDNEWSRLSSQWSKRIEKEGISRFHAAPLNGKKGEFEGWSNKRSKNFTVSLLHAISRRKLIATSSSILLDPYEKMSDKTKRSWGLHMFCALSTSSKQ